MLFAFNALAYSQVPPSPPPGGSDLQSWQVTRRFNNTPITELPVDNEYSPWRLRLALRALIYDEFGNLIPPSEGGGKAVRGWHGYDNILTGIQTSVIIISTQQEWNILVEYAEDNGKDLDVICGLAETKGSYTPPLCPGAPLPFWLNVILIFSLLFLFKKVYKIQSFIPLKCLKPLY